MGSHQPPSQRQLLLQQIDDALARISAGQKRLDAHRQPKKERARRGTPRDNRAKQ